MASTAANGTIEVTPPAPAPPTAADALLSSSLALQEASIHANDTLRAALLSVATGRDVVLVLSRELVQIQTGCRLLSRHTTAGALRVPDTILVALEAVVAQTVQLLGIAMLVVDQLSTAAEDETHATSLRHMTSLMETAKTVIEVGVDAMSFTPPSNDNPQDTPSELPSYQSTQLLQDTVNLRLRTTNISAPAHSTFDSLKPAVIDFVDTLQAYLEESTGTLIVPPAPENNISSNISDVASLHSVQNTGALTPAYSPINVSFPAPSHLSLRHLSKREVSTTEITHVAFCDRKGILVVAACTGSSGMKFFSVSTGYHLQGTYDAATTAIFSYPGTTYCMYPLEDISSPGKEKALYLIDHPTGTKLHRYRWPEARPLAFSRDGRKTALAGANNRIGIFQTSSHLVQRQPLMIHSHMDTVSHALFTPDSHALVTMCVDGTLRLTDPLNLETLAKLDTGATKKPLHLGVCPDSNLVVAIYGDTVYRWDHPTGAFESYTLSARRGREGVPIALSPDCRFLACRVEDGMDITDVHKGTVLFTIRFQTGFLTGAAFSDDSKYLAVAKATSWSGMRVTKSTLDLWELT